MADATSTAPGLATSTNSSQQQALPREKKRSYTVEEKLAIVTAAKSESLRAVAKRFNVDRNCIRAWRHKESQLAELPSTARRLPGAGRRSSNSNHTMTMPTAAAASLANNANTAESALHDHHSATYSASSATDTNNSSFLSATSNSNTTHHHHLSLPTPTSPPTATAAAATTTASASFKSTTDEDFLLIGFQGKHGAFSDVAAHAAFSELQQRNVLSPSAFETVGYNHTRDVLAAIERGEVEFGVLPLENSISGTFHGNLDRLVASHVKIVGEIAYVHELCLCARPNVTIDDIRVVVSHPAVLDHCDDFVCALEADSGCSIDRQATWDSAGACAIVQSENDATVAAVASEQAAAAHGLIVLRHGIGNELNNETRYMILGRLDASPLPLGSSLEVCRMKASLVIAVPNEPQMLFKIVAAFALRNVMIVKIESRPAATAGSLFTAETHHWDYIFYVDFIASPDDVVNDRLRSNLEEFALWIKDLGTYASSSAKANVEPPRWKNICSVIAC